MIETIDQLKSKLLSIKDKFKWKISGNRIRAYCEEQCFCPLTAIRYIEDGKIYLTMDADLACYNLVSVYLRYDTVGAADNFIEKLQRKELREWMIKNLLN